MPAVTTRRSSIQYDGTNGSFIAGTWCTAITFVSDSGTVFVYKDIDNNNQTVNLDEWLVITQVTDGYPTIQTPSNYADNFVEIPEALTLAAGYALTPSITGSGGTANVVVNLDTTFPDTGYQAKAVLTGTSALLTDLEITDVTITDADTVTVEVTNNGLIALAGATVVVVAGDLVS